MYASYKAIESEDKSDDTQWLMYWVCFAAFSLLETFSDYIIFWIPFYWFLKLAFLVALQLPQYKLPEKIYVIAVQPYMKQYSVKIDTFVDDVSKEGFGKIISTIQGISKGTQPAQSPSSETLKSTKIN